MNLFKMKKGKRIVCVMLAAFLVGSFMAYDANVGQSKAAVLNFGSNNESTYDVEHEISVLSQNLRAPQAKDGAENTLIERESRLAKLFSKYDTDIKCFQECTYEWKANLDSKFRTLFYRCVFSFNNKGLCNPIYFKMTKFKLLDAGNFVMTEDSSDTYNESRIASWAKLKDRRTKKTLLIVNAHLATEASRQVISCKKIMDLVNQQNADAYLVCGDFNFSMSSNKTCYDIMLGNEGKDVAIAAGREGIQKFTGGTFHDFGKKLNPKRIDFFFGSHSIVSNLYSIIKDVYDGKYVSDHYGILTYISIDNQNNQEQNNLDQYKY